MLQSKKTRILELFFEEPTRSFHLREISRITNIASTSVKRYLGELLQEGLIAKKSEAIYAGFIANESNSLYKLLKQQSIMLKLREAGLIDYLAETTTPTCIILFGSAQKGEYVKKSDIDIFVQSHRQKLELEKFEHKLGHKVNVLFEGNLNKLSKELFNNLANGIVLCGYLKVK